MSMDEPENPYASPIADSSSTQGDLLGVKNRQKCEAIVKDANQFWIAILLCIFCTGLGSLIIAPWYLVRLMQWQSLGRQFPMLLDRSAPRMSLPRRFQAARGKLIAGMCVGALMPLLLVGYFFLVAAASR